VLLSFPLPALTALTIFIYLNMLQEGFMQENRQTSPIDSPDDYPVGSRSALQMLVRNMSRDKNTIFGGVLVVVVVFLAIAGPWIAPLPPLDQNLRYARKAPGTQATIDVVNDGITSKRQVTFLLGTDHLGRDILSRVVAGARISLLVGVFATTLASLIGLILGSISGYFGGIWDTLIMRFADIILSFPFLILAIAVLAIVKEPSLFAVFLVLGCVGWAGISRLVRAQVLVTKELDFVKAARSLGASHRRILFRHVLPNCIAPVVIWFTMGIAGSIMAEASLSFLGLGAPPGTPSWGSMISDGQKYLRSCWWMAVFPGIMLALTVLGFNLLGDSLQDALDPRQGKR
jgi:peptide/nickel transport system permease protein